MSQPATKADLHRALLLQRMLVGLMVVVAAAATLAVGL